MSNYQNFNEKQKENLKEVFQGMKLSFKESEKIKGGAAPGAGGESSAWICLSSSCNPACNISDCINSVYENGCPFGKTSFGS